MKTQRTSLADYALGAEIRPSGLYIKCKLSKQNKKMFRLKLAFADYTPGHWCLLLCIVYSLLFVVA